MRGRVGGKLHDARVELFLFLLELANALAEQRRLAGLNLGALDALKELVLQLLDLACGLVEL